MLAFLSGSRGSRDCVHLVILLLAKFLGVNQLLQQETTAFFWAVCVTFEERDLHVKRVKLVTASIVYKTFGFGHNERYIYPCLLVLCVKKHDKFLILGTR